MGMSEGLKEILEGMNGAENGAENKPNMGFDIQVFKSLLEGVEDKLKLIQIKQYITDVADRQSKYIVMKMSENEEISSFNKGMITAEIKMMMDILEIICPEEVEEIVKTAQKLGLADNSDDDDEEDEE